MTTVALRDWILAVDGVNTWNGSLVPTDLKIVHGNDYAFALAGDSVLVSALKRFLDAGADQKDRPVITFVGEQRPNMRALVVRIGEKPVVEFYDEDFLITAIDQSAYYALGSGERYAYGAMAHGAGAIDAVKAACAHDPHSAPPIYWFNCTTGETGVVRG